MNDFFEAVVWPSAAAVCKLAVVAAWGVALYWSGYLAGRRAQLLRFASRDDRGVILERAMKETYRKEEPNE